MKPDGLADNFYFGGGGDTSITPLAFCIFLLAAALMLLLPRKYVAAPFLTAGILIQGQIVILGLHFTIYRLLIFVGWIRLLCTSATGEATIFSIRMNSLDKIFSLWAISNAITYVFLWRELGAVVNRFGFLYTTFGAYFLLRWLLRDRHDVVRTIRLLSIMTVAIAVFMLYEHLTERNALAVFGGVPDYPSVRDGRIRAQGPFPHSIVAGTIGAMLLPLFVGLGWYRRDHGLARPIGVIASVVMVITSASSTPIVACVAGLAGLAFWPLRRHARLFRRWVIASIVILHFFMKAPVWFLIARLSSLTGGTGYHRAELVDQFFGRFHEWWLVGTQNNANWGFYMWDVPNAYVSAGLEGGAVTLLLFIAVLRCAFSRVALARRLAARDEAQNRLIWTLGASLFANTVAFLGIVYFGQSVLLWYTLLAIVSVAPMLSAEGDSMHNTRRAPLSSMITRTPGLLSATSKSASTAH